MSPIHRTPRSRRCSAARWRCDESQTVGASGRVFIRGRDAGERWRRRGRRVVAAAEVREASRRGVLAEVREGPRGRAAGGRRPGAGAAAGSDVAESSGETRRGRRRRSEAQAPARFLRSGVIVRARRRDGRFRRPRRGLRQESIRVRIRVRSRERLIDSCRGSDSRAGADCPTLRTRPPGLFQPSAAATAWLGSSEVWCSLLRALLRH